MNEAKFNTKFNRYLEINWNKDTSARFELKFVDLNKKKTLNFKGSIPDHQLRALSARRHIFKIPDAGFQNPYDCYHIAGKGYLVVQFWKRAVKHFYMIDIEEIKWLMHTGDKSLNEETANKHGIKCYL